MPVIHRPSPTTTRDPIGPGMLTGAYRAVNSVRQCVAVFHGPQGCHENMYAQSCFVHDRPTYNSDRSYEPILPSTILADNDVVLGPEAKLSAAAAGVEQQLRPRLIVGLSSDAAEIIGEDPGSLAAQYPDTRTVWVACGGFKGGWVSGYAMALQALVEAMDPGETRKRTVNLVGCSGQSVTEAADIAELTRLLHRIGIRVVARLVHDTGVDELVSAPEAEHNIVLDKEFGLSLAKEMESKFKVPWTILPPPAGFELTEQWLTAVNNAVSDPIPDIDRVLDGEYRRWSEPARALTSAATVPARVAVCAEPTLAYGLARLAHEVGAVVTVIGVRTAPDPETESWLSSLPGDDLPVLIEPEPGEFARAVRDTNTTIVFGSTMERFAAADAGSLLVECVFPAVRVVGWSEPLLGYAGSVTMARLLARTFLEQPF